MSGWYLTQEYATDNPGSQTFLAPGPEEERLATGPSPWIMGRLVQLPGRCWHRLLLAVQEESPEAAEILDRWSGTADPEDPGEVLPSKDAVAVVRPAVEAVAAALRAGGVVPDAELEELGHYTQDDLARALDAVLLVVDEAVRTGEPFQAWPE